MRTTLAVLLALSAAQASAAPKLIPVGSVSLSGGQYFLDGESASMNGRADAFFAPVLRFSDADELVPVVSLNYSGTQDVQELAGGGVLTRQRASHGVSLRWVHTREFDKFKPRLSYSRSYVRETTDESWGEGLFDYRTLSAGVEFEKERYWGILTHAYDVYMVKYPNYATLLSQSASVLDSQTFSELSDNAGADVLDNTSVRAAGSLTLFPEPWVARVGAELTWRRYGDQALVDTVGGFEDGRRADVLAGLSARASRTLKVLETSCEARLGALLSNQNTYDASRTKFVADAYDYKEAGLSPSAQLRLKNGGLVRLDASWSRRFYSGRLAQSADGAYGADTLRQTVWLTQLSLRYPLWKALSARAALSYQVSSSNTRYEATYRYNYSANNVLLGFEWQL